MDSITISVITPAYNASAFVIRCYRNLLDQNFEKWQWVFVDDGSTDDTLEIINQIDDTRLTIISYKNNKGRGYARNIALDHCIGDWIVCFDVDDLHFPNKLELIFQNSKSGFDFFCSYAVLLDNNLKVKGVRGFSEPKFIFPKGFLHPTLACKADLLRKIRYSINPGPGGPGEDARVLWILSIHYNGYWYHDALTAYQEEREISLKKAFWSNFGHLKTIFELRKENYLNFDLAYLKTIFFYFFKLFILFLFFPLSSLYKYSLKIRYNGLISDDWILSEDKYSYLKKFRNTP